MNFGRQVKATVEMARTVGFPTAVERVGNFARARLLNRYRDAQFRRLKISEPVIRDVLGSKMKLDPRQHGLDRDLLLDGIREPIATGHIMRLLRSDDVVLEVGANLGYYALLESRMCKTVYAVEPHPENFMRLNANIALNAYKNIESFNIAFGAETGEIPMHCSELSNWHSCRDAVAGEEGTITVPCMRVDDFLVGRQAPTFVKMDVEGFELEVLKGAREALKHIRCLFMEIHGDILSHVEIREVLDIIRLSGLESSLIIQYDRPGMSRIYSNDQLNRIYAGDRGTFELFFFRP